MALLETLINKFGPVKGRAEFNAYHRLYRKRNRKKLRQYWKDRRAAQKVSV
jgi:hypothetical protein